MIRQVMTVSDDKKYRSRVGVKSIKTSWASFNFQFKEVRIDVLEKVMWGWPMAYLGRNILRRWDTSCKDHRVGVVGDKGKKGGQCGLGSSNEQWGYTENQGEDYVGLHRLF